MAKVCSKCKQELDIDRFWRCVRNKSGYLSQCIGCIRVERERVKQEKEDGIFVSRVRLARLTEEDQELRRQQTKEYQKEYRKKNQTTICKQRQDYMERIKKEGIEQYGGKCSCEGCNEGRYEFLTLEHINGRKDEEKRTTGKKAWQRLKRLGWPKDNYTVLCFNCNCAKGIYGTCPHIW